MTERLLLSVDEAAQSLGVTRAHLYPRVTSGEIASVKIGKSRRIPVQALQEWIERLKEQEAVSA